MTNPSRFARLKGFLSELKRRKVYRVGVAYVVAGFAVAQGAEYLFGLAGLPVMASRTAAIVVMLGLPVALILAWAYELRPDDTPAKGQSPPPESPPEPKHGASIVVLPFDNTSPDPSDAYFADGLTEEITATLSAVRELRVTSRNSATALKRAGKDTRAIGAELGVSYMLEGSVRKGGDTLRVMAQLIRADTDEHLWSGRYDGALDDVFGMQEEVALSIVRTLELHLGPEEERRLSARPMEDLRAYESYLKAREASLQWTPDALNHALDHLARAQVRVGDNAVVLAGIGYVYSQFSNIGASDRDYVSLAEAHARRALELDADNPEAHMVLGFLYQEGLRDPRLSVHHLERSLEVKPDDPHALTWLVIALSLVGRNEEMSAAGDRLMEVDPLTPMSRAVAGYARQVRGDLLGALADMELAYRGSPKGSPASAFLALSLALAGRRDESLALLRDDFSSAAEDTHSFIAHMLRAALEGDEEGMRRIMTDDLRAKAERDLQLSFYITTFYALAGLRGESLGWLRKTVDGGFGNYPWLAEHDPWLSPYRDDPEFRSLFEEVKEAWESRGRGVESA